MLTAVIRSWRGDIEDGVLRRAMRDEDYEEIEQRKASSGGTACLEKE